MIEKEDILVKYSDSSGSLGGNISDILIPTQQLNNIFDDVTGDENAAKTTEYRCIFVQNNHKTITWERVKIWVYSKAEGGTLVDIAVGDSKVIKDKYTSPDEVFSHPTLKVNALSLGNIPPGESRPVWIRRSAQDSKALNNDDFTLVYEGDSSQ